MLERDDGFAAVMVLVVVSLAACSANAPLGQTAKSPTETALPLPALSTLLPLPPTATPIPSPMSFLAPDGSPCAAAQLQLRVGQELGALGNGVAYIILTNRGSTPCALRGTPNVQLLDGRHRLLTAPPIRDSSTGYIPTHPNDGVELLPLANEGASPGPLPEGGIRGQASLPLQYGQDGCNNSVAAVRLEVSGWTFTVPLTIPQPGAEGCDVTRMYVNPFQPAEYLP
jgi:Protein of unknown function (DUF4232)